jgi:membrane-associated phospholipid phosphatase
VSVDTEIFQAINWFARATPWLHGVMAAYALWAGLTLLALFLIDAWWQARRRVDAPQAVATAVLTGVGAVVAVLVNQQLISPAIARPRPCRVLPQVEVLLPCSADYSMPSDHTMIAGAFVVGLCVLSWRYGIAAVLVALLLAFGRVYVGVHYPADTLAGLVIGGLIGAVTVFGLRRPATTLVHRLAGTRLQPLITAAPGEGMSARQPDRAGPTR